MTPSDRRYRLRQSLGRGSFGEVWLAGMESGAVHTEVAVKLLREGLDPGDQGLARLRDEGRILGLLNHPVILKVHDLLVLDGRIALVTEYVDGADLAACFADGGMPARALVEVVARVADALGVAWAAPSPTGGILALVHRDVKPGNVRIGRHGEVKLLDFGIARAADLLREARTETAAIVGTVPYMAPERFDDAAPIGSEADVFALGCVLYEGLAGRRLFGSLSTRETYLLAMDEAAFGDHVGQRIEALALPSGLRELLADTLAWDPSRRPSASELARRCEALAEELPGPGLRTYCRERAWPDRPPAAPHEGRLVSSGAPRTAQAPVPSRWPWVLAAAIGLAGVLAVGVVAVAGLAWWALPEEPVLVPIVDPPAPVPAPAPVVVPVPAPVAVPVPVPVPPPAERPAPAPKPAQGTFAVEGDVPVELRAEDRRYRPGPVPPGRYEVWADFGRGPEAAGETTVDPGGSRVLRCSRLRHNCGDP